jgi:hypothetical protein
MKYYRQVITIEVLSAAEPLAWDGINDIADAIHDGCSSGVMEETVNEEVGVVEMAELLDAQGSEPSFLIDDWYDRPGYLRVETGEEV